METFITLICRCINTPVKRQYINALFEMAVYHRKRVATFINFLSFISIDMEGFPLNFGRKIFTGFEMTELEIWSISFFDTLCSKIVEKYGSVTFKICHFKVSEYFSTKIKWEPLDINTNEWQEVDDCCYPFSGDKPFQKGHLCNVSLLGY